jgi:proteic killer suppression protein
VELVFGTEEFARICSSEAEMIHRFGPDLSRRLRSRLTELDQAASMAEVMLLPHVRAKQRVADREDQISCDLDQLRCLIVEFDHYPVPRLAGGGLDWESITSVRVLEVANSHA